MSTNTELLQKVIDTTDMGASAGGDPVKSGLLNPRQSDRFIDYMWDRTALVSMVRQVRMRERTQEIDKLSIGERIARKATEGTDDGVNADATFTKVSMTTVKIRLDWELTSEALEDNIEGEALEDHIARLMATQLGNDLEDLFINGDTSSTDALLKALDGWLKRCLAGAHVVAHNGNTMDRALFNKVIRNMPRKYLSRRGDLRFFTSPGLLQDFLNNTAATNDRFFNLPESTYQNPGGVAGQGGGSVAVRPFGLQLVEVPLLPEDVAGTYSGASGNHGYGIWTFPRNFIVGVQREIAVYREFKPKKDAIEYTVYTRVANQIENLDAVVIAQDVKLSAV
jgi:HK97 family phage major capsid protein